MPAYSSKPLAQKLGLREGTRFLFVHAPEDFTRELSTLPASAIAVTPRRRAPDLIVFFAADRASLRSRLPGLIAKLPPAGALWIAWPKLASGVPTDLRESVVRDTLLAAGLVDIKVCAINDIYSGLKFVRRLKDRGATRLSARPSPSPAASGKRRTAPSARDRPSGRTRPA